MRLPLITFDIVLAPGAAPVLTVYREDDAARIVEFLSALVRGGRVAVPTASGSVLLTSPHYVRVARVVETPFSAPSEALAAYFTLDESLMARVLDRAVEEHEAEKEAERLRAEADAAPVDEPAPADDILPDGGDVIDRTR